MRNPLASNQVVWSSLNWMQPEDKTRKEVTLKWEGRTKLLEFVHIFSYLLEKRSKLEWEHTDVNIKGERGKTLF